MHWFREEFLRIDRCAKALGRFGFVLGGMSILFGLLLLARHRTGLPLLIIGALLIGAGFFAPNALKYLHAVWIGFSLLIGWVVTRVILTIVFFLVVTPIGLLQRLAGRSPLELRFRTTTHSYWRPRKNLFATADYRNQF